MVSSARPGTTQATASPGTSAAHGDAHHGTVADNSPMVVPVLFLVEQPAGNAQLVGQGRGDMKAALSQVGFAKAAQAYTAATKDAAARKSSSAPIPMY